MASYNLRNHQADFKNFFFNNGFIGALAWHGMGLGKASRLTAKIYTPEGFKLMGQIKIGDSIIGSDGKYHKVVGVFPQGLRKCYKVTFQDGSSTEVDEDHLWSVQSVKDRYRNPEKERIKTTKELIGDLYQKGTTNSKWFIPIVKPVRFKKKNTVIPPYTLGVLIGDGCLGHGEVSYTKSDIDKEIIDRVSKELPIHLYQKSTDSKDTKKHIIKNKQGHRNNFKEEIRRLKLDVNSDKKHIPSIYKYNTVENRISLLQGLMDTDGYVSKDGMTIQYDTASEMLALDFVELVQSLGGIATIRDKHIKEYEGKTYKNITVRLPNEIPPFSLKRKQSRVQERKKYLPRRSFKSIEYIGKYETQCIKVSAPDSLYVTDDFIVTHNTLSALDIIHTHISMLKREGVRVPKALVIMPKSAHSTWVAECHKFTPYLYQDLLLIPYSQIHKAGQMAKFYDIRMIVMDESHYVKNPETDRAENLKTLLTNIHHSPNGAFKGGRILLLSGTPMLNGAQEWYTTWALCASKTLIDSAERIKNEKRYDGWKKLFAKRKETSWEQYDRSVGGKVRKKGAQYEGLQNEDKLTELLSPIVHYRRVEDCVDLPTKQEIPVDLNLPDDKLLADANIEEPEAYMALLERLARAKTPYMMDWIRDYLNVNKKRQLVVFSNYRFPIDEGFEKYKKISVKITGAETNAERAKNISDFQKGKKQIAWMTYRAGSEAINFQNCDVSLYHGYPWTDGAVKQAIARTFRSGQLNKSFHYFLTSGENDTKIFYKIREKEENTTTVENNLLQAQGIILPKKIGLDTFI